ncbi:MAG: cytochrome P450 [Sporichthyaceae bacterium]
MSARHQTAHLAPHSAKGVTRWAVRHGLGRLTMTAARRRGEVYARLVLDPALRDDPYPFYARMREIGLVVAGRFADSTAHHAVIDEVLRSPDFRSGFPVGLMPGPMRAAFEWSIDEQVLSPIDAPSMLVTDGPVHDRHRRAVSRAFTARAVADLAARVEEIAAELLDALPAGADPVEITTAYTDVLPVLVIAEMLGVPTSMRATFLTWGHAMAASLDFGRPYTTLRHTEWALRELNGWLAEHLEHLRHEPGDNLLGTVVTGAAEHDEPLTDVDLRSIAGLVLGAGFETTVNLLSNGVVALADHPEQLEHLRAHPADWRGAVHEVLRFDSPVQNTVRHAVRDVDLHGVAVPKGKFVALVLGGANRDPAVFADPDRFDVTRPNAKDHLSFGGGSHYCLGAALARLEGEVGLRMLFERFPDLRRTGTARRRPTRLLRGWAELPIALGTRRADTASVG